MSINRLINISVDYDFIFNKLDALIKRRKDSLSLDGRGLG
jgi:hypothetical protein